MEGHSKIREIDRHGKSEAEIDHHNRDQANLAPTDHLGHIKAVVTDCLVETIEVRGKVKVNDDLSEEMCK